MTVQGLDHAAYDYPAMVLRQIFVAEPGGVPLN